jgi:pyruvate,water dikinase
VVAQAEILAALRGPLAPVRRRILRWLFRYNELYMSVRDNHRYYVDRNWYELRRIYRSYGARLAQAGVLADRDEIFFLGASEVEAGLKGALAGREAGRRIEVRRRVWRATLRQQGPKFLKGWAPYADRPTDAAESGRLQGIAASPGSAVGRARVVYDVAELGRVKDGEILVTRQTDPSWTTVFGRIGGLVLETGGVLSHGTSLCREYGLPCVTAVERATVRIPDGSRIELSGSEGAIRILETA